MNKKLEFTVVFRRFDPVTKTYHISTGTYSNITKSISSYFLAK